MLRQNVGLAIFRMMIGFAFFAAVLFWLISTSMAREADGAAQDSISRPKKEICTLESGQTIKCKVRSREWHNCKITLEAGQYVRILLRYYSNHQIRVFAPDGKELKAYDVATISQELWTIYSSEVSVLAEMSGDYRIAVLIDYLDDQPDWCELQVSAVRFATQSDRKRVAALGEYTKVLRLHEGKKAGSYLKAIEIGKSAVPLLHELDESFYEADTLYIVGESCWELGRYSEAIDYYNKALPLCRAVNSQILETNILISMGQAFQGLSEYQKALDLYQAALSLLEGKPDDAITVKAWALDNIGVAYDSLGEKQKALEFHHEAERLFESLGNRGEARGKAHIFTHLGALYVSLGDKQKGIDYLYRALPLWQRARDPWGEARVYQRFGNTHSSLGDFETALNYYDKALAIWQETGDRDAEAGTLYSLGIVYQSRGEHRKALEYFNKALTIKKLNGNREGEAYALTRVGSAYHASGNLQAALDYYNQALPLWKEIANRNGESDTLHCIADAYYSLGDKERALDYYRKAIALRRTLSDREGEAATLYGIARVECDKDNLDQARADIERSLDIIEHLRTKIANEGLRVSYFAKVKDYYEFYIDLLMEMEHRSPATGFVVKALRASEQARARALLDLLVESGANIREGADAVLLERERQLLQRLSDKAGYQFRLSQGKRTEQQESAIATEIESITGDLDQVQAQIRSTSPRYSALTQPQALSAAEIQQLLDSDTLLLEYALGEKHSYLFVVSTSSLTGYQLPSRRMIEASARRFYKALNERNRRANNETGARRRARRALADKEQVESAFALSEILLRPAMGQLENKRLLIVADGALLYVPFAALPALKPNADSMSRSSVKVNPGNVPKSKYRPLVLDHEIVALPSASALGALRRELSGRKPAPKTIALLADPVFSFKDERIRIAGDKGSNGKFDTSTDLASNATLHEIKRSLRDLGEADLAGGIPRLLGTRLEANAIMKLVPAGERLVALDFKASRKTAASAEMSQYRIVHFASHALLNSVHPELSGIVLSLVDEQGRSQDGFLRVHEIFNLKLPAELVVLNACRTGLGKEVKGEGMIGLTRGFMYAGASRMLVSLWSLDDRAAAELMTRFYKRMMGPELMTPAAALRAAQVEMLEEKEWQSPHYWAGFVLQGEWK